MENLIAQYGIQGGMLIIMMYAIKYLFDKYASQADNVAEVVKNNTTAMTLMETQLNTLISHLEKSEKQEAETIEKEN